jgi:hypothetical protein
LSKKVSDLGHSLNDESDSVDFCEIHRAHDRRLLRDQRANFRVGVSRPVGSLDYRPESDAGRSGIEVAGLFDLPRLASQVLVPHSQGEEIRYQRFDWETGTLGNWTTRLGGTPLVVDGVFSTHETLRNFYDLRIWVNAPRAVRLARGLQRDGEGARSKWVDFWMPAEDHYISDQAPREHAHLAFDGSGAMADQADEVSFTVTGGLLSKGP